MIASGLERGKLGAEFFIVLDALRLDDRQMKCESTLLHRRWSKRKSTSARLVRLRDHQTNREARVNQSFERGHGKARRSAEDESRHWVIGQLSNWVIL